MRQPLAYAREYHKREAEAYRRREREQHALEEWRAVLRVQFRDAEHRAIRGDERQEDAERGVERRQKTLHRNVDELHKRRDHENEHERMDITQTKRLEQIAIKQPRDSGGDRHHEHHRAGHAHRSLRLLGHPKERTTTQKAAQNKVVHEHRTNNDDYVAHMTVNYTTNR